MGFVQAEDGLAVMTQMKGHVEPRQRQAPDDFLQVIEFGFLGLEKLAARRSIEEQVAHLDRGAHRMGGWLDTGCHVATFGFHLPGLIGIARARGQGQPRDGADRRQRLPAKAQAHDPLKVLKLANLAGGMSRQGQRQIVRRDTAAVITNPQ